LSRELYAAVGNVIVMDKATDKPNDHDRRF
jgi:hypothetical protein